MENKLITINEDTIKDISSKLVEYLDLKDSVFENEFVETFGDSFKVVKLFKTGHDLISRRKFNAFLQGFCYDDTPTEKQLLKLHKYINNETKAEFTADMFSKVLMSNSKLACMVMGIMINDLTSNENDITYDHLICANALTNFFDDDIKNYYRIVKFMRKIKTSKPNTVMTRFSQTTFLNYFRKSGRNLGSTNMTLHKSVSSQLFLSEYEVDADVDNEDAYMNSVDTTLDYSITKSGRILFVYINKISSRLE